MSKNISLYSLEKIKKEAKKRKSTNPSRTHSELLDLISIESYKVSGFREAQKNCHSKINSYFEKNEKFDITMCSLCSFHYKNIEELNKKDHYAVHLKYEKEKHKFIFNNIEHIVVQKSSLSSFGIDNRFNPIILSSSEVAVPIKTIQAYRTTVFYEPRNGAETPFEGIKFYNKGSEGVFGLLFDEINNDYNRIISELNSYNIKCYSGHTINTRYESNISASG